ncbi:MAG: N-formylglutamate amidohydrolase [Gemmobacter sp.]
MTVSAFDLHLPGRRDTAVIFASPHSGRDYPAAFLGQSVLDARAIRSSEDAFVDLLWDDAPQFGAPLLAARAPRAWLDLNRAADELDPALVEGVRHGALNPRVSSGLGVIPRVVSNGRAIYRGRLSRAEAEARIDSHWRPYHAALQRLIDESRAGFGEALLIDCHSMPHEAIAAHARPGQPVPEVVLGDRFGAAADPALVERIEAAFLRAGFLVARNTPFAGAYVTQAYGRPSRGQHVVQVEIDRALYMDENRIRPLPGFAALRARLTGVIAEIAAAGRRRAAALAAE